MAGETVAIIPCTNQKSAVPGPAREVWQGGHFQLILAHAEMFYDKVYILSFKYGLIEPDFEIEPYDINIQYSSAVDKLKWWWLVKDHIKKLVETKPGLVAVYTGYHAYERKRMMREFVKNGFRNVIVPFDGATIGQRMQRVYDGDAPFDPEKLKAGEYALPDTFDMVGKPGRPRKQKEKVSEEGEIPWED